MPDGDSYGRSNGYGPQAPYGPPPQGGGAPYGPPQGPPTGPGGPGGRFNPMNRMPSFGQRGPGRPGRRQKGPYGSRDDHGQIRMPRRKLGKKKLAILLVGGLFLVGGGFLIISTSIQNGKTQFSGTCIHTSF